MIAISHPFPHARVGAGWTWHRANGYQGGVDYVVASGQRFVSPADGWAQNLGTGQVLLTLDDGRRIGCRELASSPIPFGRIRVNRGDLLGITGRRVFRNGKWIKLWPHIDGITKQGVRVPFEPWVTKTTTPAGTTSKPIPAIEQDDDMKFLSHKTQDIWYLVGEFTVTRTRELATARLWKQAYGDSEPCTSEALKAVITVAETNAATRDAQTAATLKTVVSGTTASVVVDYARIKKNTAELLAGVPDDVADELAERLAN